MLDSSRVLQVIINLWTNAVKFTRNTRDRRIAVTLSATETRPERTSFVGPPRNLDEHTMSGEEWGRGEAVFLQIAITDTGCGIDQSESRQLFQRFSQGMTLENPVMDGLTCVQKIRDDERMGQIMGHIPVICMTANARKEQPDTAIGHGMDSVDTKPFRIGDLVPKMRDMADNLGA